MYELDTRSREAKAERMADLQYCRAFLGESPKLSNGLESGPMRAVRGVVDPERFRMTIPCGTPRWRSCRTTPATRRRPDERAGRFGAEQLARCARGEPLHNVVRAPAGQPQGA
jgi:hypothetical protein